MSETSHIVRPGGWRQTRNRAALVTALLHAGMVGAIADGAASPTMGIVASPVTLPGLEGLRRLQANPATNLITQWQTGSEQPLTLPLSLRFGRDNGVSFLYHTGTQSFANGQPTDATTYGLSDAIGSSAVHLTGLMYFSKNALAGKPGQSQAISQALSYETGGWKLDAHYLSVGKDFGGGAALQEASSGPNAVANAAAVGQIGSARGRNEMGFALSHTGTREQFGFQLQQHDDQMTRMRTVQQSLSLGETLGGGARFDVGRDITSAGQSAVPHGMLTTTTDHLHFGLDPGKGTSFQADAKLVGDSRGRSEQHMTYGFVTGTAANSFKASLLTNSGRRSGADQTVGMDFSHQTGHLAFQASFQQFSSSAQSGRSQATQRLDMTWQASKDMTFATHLTADTGGKVAVHQQHQDFSATIAAPRLRSLAHTQAVINVAQDVAQGKLQSNTRAIRFDTDVRDTHVHLEYVGGDTVTGGSRNTTVNRGIRVTSISPQDWLQYGAYYKHREQRIGKHLPDIQDYQVRMRLLHTSLLYHYQNQCEAPNGTVADVVQTHVEVGGPLAKALTWNVQYDQASSLSGGPTVETTLVGVKGSFGSAQQVELALGRPEQRTGNGVVTGETCQVIYLCKVDDDDSFAFNGEMTSWDRKTAQTPDPITAKIRLDLAKTF